MYAMLQQNELDDFVNRYRTNTHCSWFCTNSLWRTGTEL